RLVQRARGCTRRAGDDGPGGGRLVVRPAGEAGIAHHWLPPGRSPGLADRSLRLDGPGESLRAETAAGLGGDHGLAPPAPDHPGTRPARPPEPGRPDDPALRAGLRGGARQPSALEAAGHLATPSFLVLRDADAGAPCSPVQYRGRPGAGRDAAL